MPEQLETYRGMILGDVLYQDDTTVVQNIPQTEEDSGIAYDGTEVVGFAPIHVAHVLSEGESKIFETARYEIQHNDDGTLKLIAFDGSSVLLKEPQAVVESFESA